MAVLKRPRVVAQQRLDLEDWKSLLGSANYDAQQFIKGLISDQPCFISGFVPTLSGSDLTVTRENGCFVLPSDFSVGIDPLTKREFRLSWYCSGPSDTAPLSVSVKENDFVYLTLNYKDTNFVNKSFYNSATGESYTKSSPAEEELELGIDARTETSGEAKPNANEITLCKIVGGEIVEKDIRNNIYDGETIGGEPVNLRTIIKKLLGGVTSPTTKSSGSSLKSIYQQILSCLVAAPETTNSRFEFAANGIFRLEADPLAFLYNKGVLDIAAKDINTNNVTQYARATSPADTKKDITGYFIQNFSTLGLTYNNEKDETETLTVTDATKLKTRLSLEWISKDSSGHIVKVVPITESDIHWTGDEDFSDAIQIPIYGEVGIGRGSSWHLHIPVEGVHVSVSQPQVVAKLRLFGNKLNICLQDTTKIIEDGQILYFDIPNPDTSEIGFSYDTEIIITPVEYKTVDRNDFEINTHKYWLAYREGERIYLRNGTVLYSGHESEIGVDDVSDNFLKNIIGVDDEAQVPDYTDGETIKGANERGFRGNP